MATSFRQTSSVVLVAANKHQRYALAYIICTLGSFVISYILIRIYYLQGVALALLIVEFFMVYYVIKNSLELINENFKTFMSSVIRAPIALANIDKLRRLI